MQKLHMTPIPSVADAWSEGDMILQVTALVSLTIAWPAIHLAVFGLRFGHWPTNGLTDCLWLPGRESNRVPRQSSWWPHRTGNLGATPVWHCSADRRLCGRLSDGEMRVCGPGLTRASTRQDSAERAKPDETKHGLVAPSTLVL
jgi:hypothetical protein